MPQRAFQRIDADPAQLLVAVVTTEDDVGATMQLTFIPGLARGGATRLQIEAVRVRSDLRGKGLGGAMMMWAIAEGRRRGAKLVQLTSDGSRVVAQLAASITFLLSDDGTNINGTILASDGAWSAL